MCIGNRHETAGKTDERGNNFSPCQVGSGPSGHEEPVQWQGGQPGKKDQPWQGAAPEYFFMLVILRCYRFFTAKQTELPAPPIDLFNKEKHQERRKGNGSSFEAA